MILLFLIFRALLPVETEYQVGNYEAVVELSPTALSSPDVSRSDSIRIYTVYGSALVALGRTLEAADAFRELVRIKPGYELSPEQFSPKIRQVFDAVKAEQMLRPVAVRIDTVLVRPKPSLAVLCPGLSQIQHHRPAKGYILVGLGIGTATGLVASHLLYNNARKDYLAASTPAEIEAAYQTANRLAKTRFTFGCALAGTWLYNLIDGLLRL
ncbi:MAG: hypothetical protein ABIL25_04375 [candidate division WOR-3 bacterium]